MTHPQFKSQAEYDKNHQKMKTLRQEYFDSKIDYKVAIEKLITEFKFGKWGANRTVTVWDEELKNIIKIKKAYLNKKLKCKTVIEKLLRIADFDNLESEKLIDAWDNEPKKEKAK